MPSWLLDFKQRFWRHALITIHIEAVLQDPISLDVALKASFISALLIPKLRPSRSLALLVGHSCVAQPPNVEALVH